MTEFFYGIFGAGVLGAFAALVVLAVALPLKGVAWLLGRMDRPRRGTSRARDVDGT